MKLLIGKIQPDDTSLVPLESMVRLMRPRIKDFSAMQVNGLVDYLRADPELKAQLVAYLGRVLAGKDTVEALCESGILPGTGFFHELYRKSARKILPEIYPENDLRYIIAICFSRKTDHKWISEVSADTWNRLWDELSVMEEIRATWRQHVANALVVLSHRVTSLGLEPELSSKLPDIDRLDSPFITQSGEIIRFVEKLTAHNYIFETEDTDYRHIRVLLNQCEEILQQLRKRRNEFGASISLTYIIVRLYQHINRIRVLLDVLSADAAVSRAAFNRLLLEIIRAENTRNSVFRYISQNIDLIAYQVTEHASKTGEHYITETGREYFSLFRSSMKGGFIVGFMALFKVLIYYLRLAPFGQAFLYSMNYAGGFITMQFTSSALATKQPALTAQKLASSLDTPDQQPPEPRQAAEMIARVSRSQFISFIGNLLIVFPMGLLLAYLFGLASGRPLAVHEKAEHMVGEIHPVFSGSIIFAAIAGFYLFLSGIISGYFDNLVIYQNIPRRLKEHPALRKILSHRKREKLGRYVENNLGSLAGNFFFGVFMGTTPIMGEFFGIGMDVRHITFAAANLGIALVSLDFQVSGADIGWAIAGIVIIGFVNFAVSFSLAFYVAIKARRMSMSKYPLVIREVFRILFRSPRKFFIP